MTDLTKTIEPKSDQLNADDLIIGPMTITVTAVKLLSGEQPVSICYHGDNGKPYKPCKSMRRLLISVWGSDGNKYIGRSMTIFRDNSVTFGKDAVGGIRISHMSHIDHRVTIALTKSRGRREPYTVDPLPNDGISEVERGGNLAAIDGTESLRTFWESLSIAQKKQMEKNLEKWKEIASKNDVK
jgi:hypothetical protein